ncbi:amino acid permease [Micromonospora sp. M12]
MLTIGGVIGTGLFLGSGLAVSMAGPTVLLTFVVGGLLAIALTYAATEMAVAHPDLHGFGALAHRYLGPSRGSPNAGCTGVWSRSAPAPRPSPWESTSGTGGRRCRCGSRSRSPPRRSSRSTCFRCGLRHCRVLVLVRQGRRDRGVPRPRRRAPHRRTTRPAGDRPVGGHRRAVLPAARTHRPRGRADRGDLQLRRHRGARADRRRIGRSGRDLPRAARGTILRVCLFYLLSMVVIVSVSQAVDRPPDGALTTSPFVLVFEWAGLPAAAAVMNFVVLTAALSALNTVFYVSTRTLHSLAVDGQAPAWARRVNRHGVPVNAVAASAIGLPWR